MRSTFAVKRLFTCLLMAAVLVVIISGMCSICAMGRNRRYFSDVSKECEQEYIKSVKGILADYGVYNAGINLTKTSEDGTSIEYTVVINSYVIDKMDDAETAQLYNSLIQTEPAIANSTVEIRFGI